MDADTKKEKFNFKTMGIRLFNLQINTKMEDRHSKKETDQKLILF